jgi:hypothetical protein
MPIGYMRAACTALGCKCYENGYCDYMHDCSVVHLAFLLQLELGGKGKEVRTSE